MRHGILVSITEPSAVVTLDGVDVTCRTAVVGSPVVGRTAVVLQEGRRMVAIGTIGGIAQ